MAEDGASEGSALAGRYELGALLGRGGMGSVREAEDLRLGRLVAVKILRADLADQPVARRRFEIEARAAASLSHPNVVTVFDSGEENGIPFLVMERLPGRTLADELTVGAFPLGRVYEVAREILSALGAAHQAGIVHRDIKPGNVLLTSDDHAKVSDFGIAKTVDDIDQTQTLELIATLGYLAPERLSGEPASRRSDLYSVGVLLYEVVSGRRPFAESTPAAEMLAIERSTPEPLASLRSPLPEGLRAVVERAMARDPALRFESAEEMVSALGEIPKDVVTVSTRTAETVPIETVATVPIDARSVAETVPARAVPRDHATEVLRPSTREVEPRRDGTLPLRTVGLALAALIVVALVAVFLANRVDNGARSPATTTPTTLAPGATNLPAPLDNAIDRLEQEIGS